MEPTTDEGVSNDMTGMRSGISQRQPQNAFSKHGISYLEPNTEMGGLGSHTTVPHPHPMSKLSDTGSQGSPPPNSATTSGSTSTPTSPSTGGLYSSADSKMNPNAVPGFATTDLGDGSSSNPLEPLRHQQQNEGNWPVSAPEANFSHQYSSSPGFLAPASVEKNLSQSLDENASSHPSAIKLLVSNNVAGFVIGRAGQTISEIQEQSSARIKLSQTGDYYPGTQDRVCLVQGQLECVKVAVRLLLERFYMLQEQQHSQHLAWQPKSNEPPLPMGFDFVIRLLVPSSSCGMIIGKAGSNIKLMEEVSGISSVRLSPKEITDPPLPLGGFVSGTSERVVTLTGHTIESCLSCLHLILDGMLAHHEICRYTNLTTSYSRVVLQGTFGGVPSAPPVNERPHHIMPTGASPESPIWDSGTFHFGAVERSSSSPDLAGQMLWDHRSPPQIPQENLATSMARQPPTRGPIQSYNPVFTESPQPYPRDPPPIMSSPSRGPGGISPMPIYLLPPSLPDQMDHGVSAPDLLALQLQDSLRINTAQPSSAMDHSQFAPQLPQATPPGFTAQVLVPDILIGSILGRGGRTLNELQMHSNTRIRISQRGEYVPGTRNRVVTIRGPTAHSVSLAQYLMSQRMVLPPTAAYSPQSPFHPPPPIHQTQQPHQQLPPQHPSLQPQLAHRHDVYLPQYHVSPVESPFQGFEAHAKYPSSGSSYPA